MTFEIYRRITLRGRQWFWRLKSRNHRVIAVGGEGFNNLSDVKQIINRMINDVGVAEVKVLS